MIATTIRKIVVLFAFGLLGLLALTGCSVPQNIGIRADVNVDGTSVPVDANIQIGSPVSASPTPTVGALTGTGTISPTGQFLGTAKDLGQGWRQIGDMWFSVNGGAPGNYDPRVPSRLPAVYPGAQITLTAMLPGFSSDAASDTTWYMPDCTTQEGEAIVITAPATTARQVMVVTVVNKDQSDKVVNVMDLQVLVNGGTVTGTPMTACQDIDVTIPMAPAAPAAASPAPTTFDPANPSNPVTITVDLPDGWGQEDRYPLESGEIGHEQLIVMSQLYNPTLPFPVDANDPLNNIQIATFPGVSLELDIALWEGSSWLNNGLHIDRYLEMAQEQVDRARANGGDIPLPATFIVDGEKQIWRYDFDAKTWNKVTALPEGIALVDSTFSELPALSDQACPATDQDMEAFNVFHQAGAGDLPLGDKNMFVEGYAFHKNSGPTTAFNFVVAPDVVLWIPANHSGAKRHTCEMPANIQADTLVIDSPDFQLPDELVQAGFHVTPFSAPATPTP